MPVCEYCDKEFTRKDNLGKHYQNVHNLSREQFPASYFEEKHAKRVAQKCPHCSAEVVNLPRHVTSCKAKPKNDAKEEKGNKRDAPIPPSPVKFSEIDITDKTDISKHFEIWLAQKGFNPITKNQYMQQLGDQLKRNRQRRMTALALNDAFRNFKEYSATLSSVRQRKTALQACNLTKKFFKQFGIDLDVVRVPPAAQLVQDYLKGQERAIAYQNLNSDKYHQFEASGIWSLKKIESFLKLELLLLFKSEEFVKNLLVSQIRALIGTDRQLIVNNKQTVIPLRLFKILVLFMTISRPKLMGENVNSCKRFFSSYRNTDNVTIGSDVFQFIEEAGKSPFYIKGDDVCSRVFIFCPPVDVLPFQSASAMPIIEPELAAPGAAAMVNDDMVSPQVSPPAEPKLRQAEVSPSRSCAGPKVSRAEETPPANEEVAGPSGWGSWLVGMVTGGSGTRRRLSLKTLNDNDIKYMLLVFKDYRRAEIDRNDVLCTLVMAEDDDRVLADWVVAKIKEGVAQSCEELATTVFNMLKNNLR